MMGLDRFFKPRLTELGKIKIGGKSAQVRKSAGGNEWRAPEKHDHFTVVGLQRDAKGDLIPSEVLMARLVQKYGDEDGKLRQLPICVLSNDPDEIMQTAWVWYGGRTVGARSDGETVTWYNDPANGRKLDSPREEPWKDEFAEITNSRGQKLFKMHTVFNCVLRMEDASWGGVYKFRTTSVISGRQLYSGLLFLLQTTAGILQGLPLFLAVRPIQVAPQGKATTVYVVHVEMRADGMEMVLEQANKTAQWLLANRAQMAKTQAAYKQLLLPPGSEDAREQADINEEFQPDTADYEPVPTGIDPLLTQDVPAAPVPPPEFPEGEAPAWEHEQDEPGSNG